MLKAILYTSNTGTTAQYAKLLGERTSLPVFSMEDAAAVPAGAEVIYLGWVMGGGVKGCKAAFKRYAVKAVCGVCMGGTGTQIDELRQKNAIPDTVPVFTMQGGFDINKLHGFYKMMMQLMLKTAGKGLAEKQDRTKDEDAMLDMMRHGGSHVSENNLRAVLDWYKLHQEA